MSDSTGAHPPAHASSDAAATDALRGASPEGPPTGTRRRGWFRGGVPQVRPPRRFIVRAFIALTSSTALLGVAGLVAAAAIVPPIGARRTARDAAQREVRALLGRDERVVESAFASQRRWTDMWRESFGIVVATDRRLLYVGAPPTPLLRPIEDGPSELLVESYPYDRAFTLEPRTLLRGYGRGLVLRMPLRQVDFLVDDAEWSKALAVSAASAAARTAIAGDMAALEASNRPVAAPAAVYVTYIVRRGETLTGLARRFETSPDVLRQLNQLQNDDIRVGQRLRVPQVTGQTP